MAPKRSAPEVAAPVEEETSFPRGGGSALSAVEAKQLRAEGAAEARAEAKAGGGRKKRRTDADTTLVSRHAPRKQARKAATLHACPNARTPMTPLMLLTCTRWRMEPKLLR